MNFKALLSLLVLFISNYGISQNYTKTIEPKVPLSSSQITSTNPHTLLQTINYSDGMGRQIQTIAVGQSPLRKDIVQHFEYDNYGRQNKQYLPAPTNQSNGDFIQNTTQVINTYYQNEYGDNRPYSEVRYSNSSLGRILEHSNVGQDYVLLPNDDTDHTLKYEYALNDQNEIFKYDILTDGSFAPNGYYVQESLFKNITKNENWKLSDGLLNTTEVFSEKSGRKIAEVHYDLPEGENIPRKLTTQYIYDDSGRLLFVLPPKFNSGTSIGSYQDYQIGWSINDFLAGGKSLGNVIFSIREDVLRVVTFGKPDTGVKVLASQTAKDVFTIPNALPNMYLGKVFGKSPIVGFPDFEIGEAEIINGDFVITRTSSNSFESLIIDIEINLLSPQITQDNLDHLVFQYKYDIHNRKIAQKTAGRGWEYIVYDDLDRPLLTQDANLRKKGKWLFNKYDAFSRTVYTGMYSSNLDQGALQAQVDSFLSVSSNKSNVESRSPSLTTIAGIPLNYSNNAFPNSNIASILSVNYYDNYSFNDVQKPQTPATIEEQAVTTKTQGLLTGNWTRVLNQNTPTWIKTYTYYDDEARPIRNYQVNQLGGNTIVDSQLDFRGKTERSITKHKRLSGNPYLTIEDRFSYDNAERVTTHTQVINNQHEERIANNSYNELGLLVSKGIGGLYNGFIQTNPLQTINYTYNIQGKLQAINDVDNIGTDLFAYNIKYNDNVEGTVNVPELYNGNIRQVIWKNAVDNIKKSYAFEYDHLNRLYSSHFRENNSLSSGLGKYETYRIGYDTNGNIKVVRRNNHLGQQIDKLGYTYDQGNKLMSIDDLTQNPAGFTDGYNSKGEDYLYDENGNLIDDRNKSIIGISYNFLDLVEEIVINRSASVDFTYDASGLKLAKLQKIGANANDWVNTEYIGGFQYINGDLKFFPSAEGYVYKDGNIFKYAYVFSDHSGNNRLSYTDSNGNGSISLTEVLSKTDYYPLGLIHHGEQISGVGSLFNYKFQGKEIQEDFGANLYDFGARLYDPSVGRWFNTDPLNQFYSPYIAFGNNSIRYLDPDGQWALIDDAIAIVIGGTVNVVANWGNIESFGDGAAYFGIGALAGEASLYGGPLAGAAVLSVGNSAFTQYNQTGTVNAGQLFQDTLIGTATAGIGAKLTPFISGYTSKIFGSSSSLFTKYANDAIANTTSGFLIGTGAGLAQGQSFGDAVGGSVSQIPQSLAISFVGTTGSELSRIYHPTKGTKAQQRQAEIDRSLEAELNQSQGREIPSFNNGINDSNGFTFRALNDADVLSLSRGEGIFAKAPSGTWTLEQHLVQGSSTKAWTNSPWVSTSSDINIARSFNSGNGLIQIDLSKLSTGSIQRGYLSLPRTSAGYHFSLWQQEVSIFQSIPRSAIKFID